MTEKASLPSVVMLYRESYLMAYLQFKDLQHSMRRLCCVDTLGYLY